MATIKLLFRPVELPTDLERLDRLFQLCLEADGHWPIGEHKYLALKRGDESDSISSVVDNDDSIVGFSQLVPSGDGVWALEVATHPLHRSAGVLELLIDCARRDGAAHGADMLRMWVYQAGMVGLLRSYGFRQERELRQMRIGLPAGRPQPRNDAVIRPFRPGIDNEAWLDLNNQAFAGHPENGTWTPSILDDRLNQPWFDASGFLIAWIDNAMAGFCWTKVHPGGAGEIYVIAVEPDLAGRGLGSWLVLEGLQYLSESRACDVGLLYVDASNEPAVQLYERLGFWVDHTDRSFVLVMDDVKGPKANGPARMA